MAIFNSYVKLPEGNNESMIMFFFGTDVGNRMNIGE